MKALNRVAVIGSAGVLVVSSSSLNVLARDTDSKNNYFDELEEFDEVEISGNIEKHIQVLHRGTLYVPDTSKTVGEREIIQEGEDGQIVSVYKNGEYVNTYVIPFKNQIIKVGVQFEKMVEEEYPTEVIGDITKWDNYSEILQEGKNRVVKSVGCYELNRETGQILNKVDKMFSNEVVQEGQKEVVVKGTKRPVWENMVVVGDSIPYNTEYIPVSDGSLQLGEQNVIQEGINGSILDEYLVACDKEGNIIDSYEPRVGREGITSQEMQNKVTEVGVLEQKTSDIIKSTEYVESDKEVGYINEISEGRNGIEATYNIYDLLLDGSLGNVIESNKSVLVEPENSKIEVGTRESVTESLKYNVVVQEDNTKPEDYEEVINAGVNGEVTSEYKYSVDPVSGELINKAILSQIVLKESVNENKVKGTLKYEDMECSGIKLNLESYKGTVFNSSELPEGVELILENVKSGMQYVKNENELRSKLSEKVSFLDLYNNDMKYTIDVDNAIYGESLAEGKYLIKLTPVGKNVGGAVVSVYLYVDDVTAEEDSVPNEEGK